MEEQILNIAAQSGVAGLIGLLWLLERRASGQRDRQIGEAHDRLMEQRVQLEQLLRVVAENTTAVSSLESAQRTLTEVIARLADRRTKQEKP